MIRARKIFLLAVIGSLLLTSFSLSAMEVMAQGICPASGTFGKDVGRDFFVQVVGLLKDVPQSELAVSDLMAWKPYENTKAFWNPLATTWKMSPVCNFNSKGVQNFTDQDNGARATANTLSLSYYDSIRRMFRQEAFDREALRRALGTWGTCTGPACNTLLNAWQGLYTAPSGGPVASNTSTVLVFDSSGSMGDPDASGMTKLEAAKQAGGKLLDVIGAENQATTALGNDVAIVQFGQTANVNINLTKDVASAKNALQGMASNGGTAMPKGLRAALDLYPANPGAHSFIILLTDGLANIGLNDEQDEATARQQVLNLADEAGRRAICIYTVGFGDPASSSIDETFLQDIATKSLCGSYHNARDAWQLANVYINLRHASTGNTLLSQSGSINQDQVVNLGDVQVPANQEVILFTLDWPGSQLDGLLQDPSGQLVGPNYANAFITRTDTLESVIIQGPLAGRWNISVRGITVPEGTTQYSAALSVRPNPNPPAPPPVVVVPVQSPSQGGGSPLAIILIVLAVVGLLTYTLVHNSQRYGPRATSLQAVPGYLAALNGTYAGHSIPLTDGMTIGRSSICTLRLDEPSVSRRHAQIRYGNGRWFIQDLKSQLGVYVNGFKIKATVLNRGDRVRIGSIEFVFS